MALSAAARPAIFLDKDGTLLENVPYNADPRLMRWAPTAREAVVLLAALEWPLVVVSNQAGVALRRFPEAALRGVEDRLRAMFADCGAHLAAFRYCPHGADQGCACRKPRAGMLLACARELRLDLAASWMVGDVLDDVEAGRRAGCRTVLVDNGNETEWRRGRARAPHWRAPTLLAAVRHIAAAARQAA